MANNKIPGIHNYCDRWCERCYFTTRCSVFADESGAAPGVNDIKNEAFWDRLAQNFSKAKKMLEQAAERYGVDLNAIAKEIDDIKDNEEKLRKESEDHPIGKLSWEYAETAREWLTSQPGMIKKLEELRDALTLGVESTENAKTKTETIKDCLAVIQWYQTFIHVKFMRALMGKIDDDAWEKENSYQRDFDGSAKVAIIGVERSMQAWLKLYELIPEGEDNFLKILGMLEKLKTLALEEFPKALAFKRPGFDD